MIAKIAELAAEQGLFGLQKALVKAFGRLKKGVRPGPAVLGQAGLRPSAAKPQLARRKRARGDLFSRHLECSRSRGSRSQSLRQFPEPRACKAILAAFTSSPASAAAEFLLGLLAGKRSIALGALSALMPKPREPGIHERAEKAALSNKNRALRDELLERL